jgi:hypothetical protein
MFRQSATSATSATSAIRGVPAPLATQHIATRICSGNPPLPPLLPLITHHAARATEPETTGRQFAKRLRVCWPVIACHPWVDRGPDATGRIPQRPRAGCGGAYSGRNPRGGKLHQEIAAPLSGRKRTHRAGQLQAPGHAEPGTIRHVTAPLTRPVVAASWHPAIGRSVIAGNSGQPHYPPRYRQRNRVRLWRASAPIPTAKSGQDAVSIRPVIAASWRRDYAAQSGHQRLSAPRSQRVGAPLPATW